MGQITKDFAEQMLVHCARGEHPPLTVWEAEQLARFAMQAITTAPQAQLAEGAAETLEQKNERNARVQARYDALMQEGRRGHYETLFRVVREEVGRALAQQVAPQAQQATYHLSPAEQSVMSAALRKSVVSVEAQQAGSQAATLTDEHAVTIARVLADRSAEQCNVDKDDNWKVYGEDFLDDARAIIAALQAKG